MCVYVSVISGVVKVPRITSNIYYVSYHFVMERI